MVTKQKAKQAIKEFVDSRIFTRGIRYYLDGQVRSCTTKQLPHGNHIFGDVKGSRLYHATIDMNVDMDEVLTAHCSCPYKWGCKHIVALALAAAELLEDEPSTKPAHEVEMTDIITDLKKIGIDPELVAPAILENLLNTKQTMLQRQAMHSSHEYSRNPKPVATAKKQNTDPQNFVISLSRYDSFRPTLNHKSTYQQASIKPLLKSPSLTPAQHALLEYINEGNFTDFRSPPPDPAVLFPLLVDSGFDLSAGYYHSSNKIHIDLNPKPLEAEILYEPRSLMGEPEKIRHDFLFRIPKHYLQNNQPWYESSFIRVGSSIIHERGQTLDLHRLTPELADLIEQAQPHHDYSKPSRPLLYWQSRLDGTKISQYASLCGDARRLLRLTQEPPTFHTQGWSQSDPIVLMHYEADNNFLQLTPVIDYGCDRINIAETIYLARRQSGSVLTRREHFSHPGSHIVSVKDETIHHAQIDEEKERSFFEQLQSSYQELGFTKTLKGHHKGQARIKNFVTNHWHKLLKHADTHGYRIISTHDELPTVQSTFHADVDLKLNEKEDWLYFDVTCYCDGEKISLKALMNYLEGRTPYIHRPDGTLIEVTNRDALEQLARLLKSFHEREDGQFEGALHHAPELRYIATQSAHYNTTQSKAFEKLQKRLYAGKPIKSIRLSKPYEQLMRPYQKEGVKWLYFLRSFHFGGILADEMGLGKTLQTLVVLDKEKVKERPSLVVCPKTLIYNWQSEAKKFCPKMKVLVYAGSQSERKHLRKQFNKYDLIVTGYATLKTDELFLTTKHSHFNYVVLDEAQAIKNPKTKAAQAVKKLHADFRLVLTGTPIENNVAELWSIFDFLMPGFLGSYAEFNRRFYKPIMDHGDRDVAEHLRRKISCFMLRRTKDQVLKELPPKIEQASICKLSDSQNLLYQQILSQVRSEILDIVETKGYQQSQIHILAALTKLRQVCNHPALLLKEKRWDAYASAKLESCLEIVEEVAQSGRKVLIFSQFTSMLEIIKEALQGNNVPYTYLSGKTTNRKKVVDDFNDNPDIPVFLISLKAGGVGLNLTSADTVIIFDPWWNPSVENQAIDRTHRIGQQRPVHVHRLLTMGTIEEKIQALKEKKQGLFDVMVGASKDLHQKLTWEDVKKLFDL